VFFYYFESVPLVVLDDVDQKLLETVDEELVYLDHKSFPGLARLDVMHELMVISLHFFYEVLVFLEQQEVLEIVNDVLDVVDVNLVKAFLVDLHHFLLHCHDLLAALLLPFLLLYVLLEVKGFLCPVGVV
jgi:hypothetical protein